MENNITQEDLDNANPERFSFDSLTNDFILKLDDSLDGEDFDQAKEELKELFQIYFEERANYTPFEYQTFGFHSISEMNKMTNKLAKDGWKLYSHFKATHVPNVGIYYTQRFYRKLPKPEWL